MASDRLLYLQNLLDSDPTDSFLKYAIAKEYEKDGNLHQALQSYKDLRKDDPHYIGLYYHLGKLLEELDQHKEAIIIYDEGIRIAKEQSDYHALSELNNAKTNAEIDL